MDIISFEILLNAPPEKVWTVLWGNATYPVWTAVFSEGSHAVTDWKKGSKVLFLNGKNRGMVSLVSDCTPHEYMEFTHLGEVKNGVETLYNRSEYPGFKERYTLTSVGIQTKLLVKMSVPEGLNDYLQRKWPKALASLKTLVE